MSYIPSESPSSISWVGTVQSALLSMIGVLAGPLFDLGAYRSMTVVGALLVLVGLFTLSLSTTYYQIFLSHGVCIGIGGGLLYVPSLALVSSSFKKRRALALGTLTSGIGIGMFTHASLDSQQSNNGSRRSYIRCSVSVPPASGWLSLDCPYFGLHCDCNFRLSGAHSAFQQPTKAEIFLYSQIVRQGGLARLTIPDVYPCVLHHISRLLGAFLLRSFIRSSCSA